MHINSKFKALFLTVIAALLLTVAFAAPAAAAPAITPDSETTVDQNSGNSFLRFFRPSIVEIAVAVNQQIGEFSTLIAALSEAELVETLDSPGAFTVFAPTDAAFAELGLNADNIHEVDIDTLTDILLYHVSQGRRSALSVFFTPEIRMLNGDSITPNLRFTGLFVNDSRILVQEGLFNIRASNGIIHVIDAVLIPPMDMGGEEES